MNRPINTLFMLSSVDGKISTGDTDKRDVDKDLPKIKGISSGLKQYYEIEKTTDLFSLNTGRVFSKIGFNQKKDVPNKLPVTFVVIDNKPHLTENGVRYIAKKSKRLILVTTNKKHPAFRLRNKINNIDILSYNEKIDFADMFRKLKSEFGAKRVTIQSGGTLNAELIRKNLIDYVSLVVAPIVIGGKSTSTLIDGQSLRTEKDLSKIKALQLKEARRLKNSYLYLKYKVVH